MGKGYRQGRLGEELRRLISQMLLRELKDPRLQEHMISVSAVEVTRDGSYATVYISVLGLGSGSASAAGSGTASADPAMEEILDALKKAKGTIKREIGRQIKLRHVPELIFKADNSMEYGRHISQVLGTLGIEPDAPSSDITEDDFDPEFESDFDLD